MAGGRFGRGMLIFGRRVLVGALSVAINGVPAVASQSTLAGKVGAEDAGEPSRPGDAGVQSLDVVEPSVSVWVGGVPVAGREAPEGIRTREGSLDVKVGGWDLDAGRSSLAVVRDGEEVAELALVTDSAVAGEASYALSPGTSLGAWGDGTFSLVLRLASADDPARTYVWESQAIELDATAPVATVAMGPERPAPGVADVYRDGRTLTVTVRDGAGVAAWPQVELDGLALEPWDGGSWAYGDDGRSASATFRIADDGSYEKLEVRAADALGNGGVVAARGFEGFTVDGTPAILLPVSVMGKHADPDEPMTSHEVGEASPDNPLYVQEPTLTLRATDATFDAEGSSVEGDLAGDSGWSREGDGTFARTVSLREGAMAGDLRATVGDLAGNEPSELRIPAGSLVYDAHAPEIGDVTYGGGLVLADGARLREGEGTLTVRVSDANLLDGADGLAVTAVRADGGAVAQPAVSVTEVGNDDVTYALALEDGGYSELSLTATDKAGRTSARRYRDVAVDTHAPTFDVRIEEEAHDPRQLAWRDEADGLTYCPYGLVGIITVREENFDPELFEARNAARGGELVAVTWLEPAEGSPNVHVGTFSLGDGNGSDGRFRMEVSGRDAFGNEALTGSGESVTSFAMGDVVIDTRPPEVRVTSVEDAPGSSFLSRDPKGTGLRRDYFSTQTSCVITITDENFSRASTKLLVDGTDQYLDWQEDGVRPVAGGSVMLSFRSSGSTHVCEVSYGEGDHGTPCVVAYDKAGNHAEEPADSGSTVPFTVDLTDPLIRFEGEPEAPDNPAGSTPTGKDYFNRFRTIRTTVTERNWDPAGAAGVLSIENVRPVEGRTAVATPPEHRAGTDSHVYTTVLPDGDYRFSASVTDLSGRTDHGTERIPDFVVDTVAPAVSVSFGGGDARNGRYFDGPRTMTVTVTERNFDPSRFRVDVATSDSDHDGICDLGSADAWVDDGDTHTLTHTFDSDGTYAVTVSGSDLATNEAEPVSVDEFVIDQTPPEVRVEPLREPDAFLGDVPYYRQPIGWSVSVTDRNLDVGTADGSVARVLAGRCVPTDAGNWSRWTQTCSGDGNVTWTRLLSYDELSGAEAGRRSLSPYLRAVDLAGNDLEVPGSPFCVDRTAPSVVMASVDREPSQTAGPSEGAYQFYNQATSMTMAFHDPYGLESAVVADPDGAYRVSNAIRRGATDGRITIVLRDGTQSATDAEFERNITLTVTDLVGNVRAWTIDRRGNVVDDASSPQENVSLNGRGVYPNRLIEDVTAPRITLSGPAPGAYYSAEQAVHVAVDEFNLRYLQRFDGSRPVVHVTRREGAAGGVESGWDIPVSALVGDGSAWAVDQVLREDGHYTLVAGFFDYANNESNRVGIGEFTIDGTAPVVTVDWDNEDVRNGRYYDAPRTATVTVVEHNFSPELFSIETAGSVSEWSTSGDTHTCTVFCGEGTHALAVSGRDLAGNAANDVTEPEFVVDTTAPVISFGGEAGCRGSSPGTLEDRHAYNGVVVPQVELSDEANFDPDGVSLTLTGGKHGDVTDAYAHDDSATYNGEAVRYGDLGRNPEGAETAYDVNADDVYVLRAHAVDLAGNVTEGEVTFSVNRFGSNFLVTMDGRDEPQDGSALLTEAPLIRVREINVSGSASEADHEVLKEYANATSAIARDDGDGDTGYRLEASGDAGERNGYGWAEYLYTIKRGNFGEGSESDAGDGGQGTYRVNVTSDDTASNANTTASFWGSGPERNAAEAKRATAQFTLDEVAPAIDSIELPRDVAVGGEARASFHVTDVITTGNDVRVTVDGEPVDVEGPDDGRGTFTFSIPAQALSRRSVDITVTDYAGRSAHAVRSGFYVTDLLPEACFGAAAAGACLACLLMRHRRREGGDA